MIPETGEDEEYESSEQDEQDETKDDELVDEMAARLEAAELLMSNQKTATQDSDDLHAWRLGDFKEIQFSLNQRLIDLDSVHNRLFLMMSDLTLIELDLLTRKVTKTIRLSEIEGAEDMGEKAIAFVL